MPQISSAKFYVSDLSVKCKRSDYLRDALTEATGSTTEVAGGLVLSKMLAVKTSGGVMVAGMTGTSQAVAAADVRASLPMIWAGASKNTTDAFCSAPFRVYNDGHVDMGDVSIVQGDNGSMGLTVNKGSLTLGTVNDGSIPTPLTQILPQSYNTVDASLSSRAASVGDNTAGTTKDMTPKLTETTNKYCYSGIKTETLKTIPASVPSGTMTLTISNASMSVSTSLSGTQKGLRSVDSVGSDTTTYIFPAMGTATVSMVFYLTVNGARKTKLVESISASNTVEEESGSKSDVRNVSIWASGSKTAAISSTVEVKFSPGDVIGLLTETTITYSNVGTFKPGTTSVQKNVTAASITLSWTAQSENYNNIYYANGLLLSSSDKKYIAANSSSTATAILQARTASAIFKFTTNGLLQSLNGSTFYRVNPLIWVAKISTESGTKAETTVIYNPLGKVFQYARKDKGRIMVTHSLGHTNYTISAHGFGANSGTAATGGNRYVYLITKAASYFEVVMNLDHVNYDGICEILLYDLKSY